jgi:hypothetical protein
MRDGVMAECLTGQRLPSTTPPAWRHGPWRPSHVARADARERSDRVQHRPTSSCPCLPQVFPDQVETAVTGRASLRADAGLPSKKSNDWFPCSAVSTPACPLARRFFFFFEKHPTLMSISGRLWLAFLYCSFHPLLRNSRASPHASRLNYHRLPYQTGH